MPRELIGISIVWAVILCATYFFGSDKLHVYVIGVAIVWAVILCATYFFGSDELFPTLTLVCGGYALGMLAMYIAMHVYKS